jgi:hypothetical protein
MNNNYKIKIADLKALRECRTQVKWSVLIKMFLKNKKIFSHKFYSFALEAVETVVNEQYFTIATRGTTSKLYVNFLWDTKN